MATALTLASVVIDAETDATTALLNGGYLRFYDGARPANPDVAVTDQQLLVELRWADPAFGPSAGGVALANNIAAGNARVTGYASWFRSVGADGTQAVMDGNVGTIDGQYDLVLDNAFIQAGALVSITSFSYTNRAVSP